MVDKKVERLLPMGVDHDKLRESIDVELNAISVLHLVERDSGNVTIPQRLW